MRKFNLFAPEFDHSSERPGYSWRGARVGRVVGGEEIGACLYELEAGQRTYPYHLHHGNEEWVFVVAGTPTVRTPEGERVLRACDLVGIAESIDYWDGEVERRPWPVAISDPAQGVHRVVKGFRPTR